MRFLFLLLVLTFFLFGCSRDTAGVAEDPAIATAPAPASAPEDDAKAARTKNDPLRMKKSDEPGADRIGRDQMAPADRYNDGVLDPEATRRYSGAKAPAASGEGASGERVKRKPLEEVNRAAEQKANAEAAAVFGPVVVSDILTPVIFTVSKTPCRGNCPQYSLTLHNDGILVLNGKKNVDRRGFYTYQLSRSRTDALISQFRTAATGGLALVYPVDEEIPADLPATKLEYPGVNGVAQVIHVYDGAPAQLQALFDTVEKMMENEDWKTAVE